MHEDLCSYSILSIQSSYSYNFSNYLKFMKNGCPRYLKRNFKVYLYSPALVLEVGFVFKNIVGLSSSFHISGTFLIQIYMLVIMSVNSLSYILRSFLYS